MYICNLYIKSNKKIKKRKKKEKNNEMGLEAKIEK